MIINKLATIGIAIAILYLLNMSVVRSMEKEGTIGMDNETGAQKLYIATDGSDENPGTKDQPIATLIEARDRIRQLRKLRGGIAVWIMDGRYNFHETLKLSAEDSGTVDCPVVYKAVKSGNVVFHGSRSIPTESIKTSSDQEILSRFCPAARGKIVQTTITDPQLIKLLQNAGSMLSFNGKVMQLARFPNVGYAHIDKILEKGAVYAHGRTFGDPPSYSMEEPIGGEFTIHEQPSGDWDKEFERSQKAKIIGYLAYDWYKQNHNIASIKEGRIKLLEYSRYGIIKAEKIPRRFFVTNLLCELNQPGEWYYDDGNNILFLWPFEPVDESTELGVWAGPTFAELSNVSHTTFQGLTIQDIISGQGMVTIEGGEHNKVAGCTLRNSTRTGVVLKGGKDNGIIGCDIYDVSGHLNLDGGDIRNLIPAGNYAINCHFTQVQATNFYGRIAVRGVGNIFRNNLIHNAIGQIMTLGGNDHRIELNEMFNIGIEEGDGGAIYSGAQMWSYGNVFQHNFLHHLMCLPQAHPRGGIYPDDLDGGDTITENVFYKAAHRAILINGGAGHTVTDNLLLNGYIGIYNTVAWAEKAYTNIARFDSGEFKRGDKGDYIWRTEQVVGKEGWNKEPWSSHYPLFRKIMNQEKMRFFPIECKFQNNLFSGNTENIQFRTGWGQGQTANIETIPYIETSGNREVEMDVFVDPESLDFRYKKEDRTTEFPDIPFEKIGLYRDQYRLEIPDKEAYRTIVRQKFRGRPSYDPDVKYEPDKISSIIYLNTGKILMED